MDGFIFRSFLQARQVWARSFTLAFFSRSVGTFVFSLTFSASARFWRFQPLQRVVHLRHGLSTAAFFSASMVLTSSAVSVAFGWSGRTAPVLASSYIYRR